VDNAARNPARHLGLDLFQRLDGVGLLARLDRRLDRLDEGPDAADPCMIDRGAIRVAADALLGLRRIRHETSSCPVQLNEKAAQSQTAAPTRPFPY